MYRAYENSLYNIVKIKMQEIKTERKYLIPFTAIL